MCKVIFLALLALVASANAFVAPVASRSFTSARPTYARKSAPQMTMSLDAIAATLPSTAQLTEISHQAMLIASTTTDFGGYTGPIAGLIAIGGLILVLSPPLVD